MTEWSKTERLSADVLFADGGVLHGDLHLQPASAYHLGAETPLDMLNRPDAFFPVTLPDGGVALVAKSQTAVVVCKRVGESADTERQFIAKTVPLVVRMAGGAEYSGTAVHEMPPTHARPLDFLNEPSRFFSITDEDTTWHINRALVQHVLPRD